MFRRQLALQIMAYPTLHQHLYISPQSLVDGLQARTAFHKRCLLPQPTPPADPSGRPATQPQHLLRALIHPLAEVGPPLRIPMALDRPAHLATFPPALDQRIPPTLATQVIVQQALELIAAVVEATLELEAH